MNINVQIHLSADENLVANYFSSITKQLKTMSDELDKLIQDVQENNDLIDSAKTLLGNIKKQLDDAGTDKTKLKALSDSLDTKDQELADAIVANTPAADSAPEGK